MNVCIHCFNDEELKHFIIVNSDKKGKCDYCSDGFNSELLEISELLDFFAEFIGVFKANSNGKVLTKLIQEDWNLFSSESECHNILSDILLALGNKEIEPTSEVDYTDEILECCGYWEKLKQEIKWEKRFLTDVTILEDYGWDRFFQQTQELSSSNPLFRARLHYSGNQKVFETLDMGCPDPQIVSAGRGNPLGIPYLYLSLNLQTTIYEVRATYLDEVSIGIFSPKSNANIILVDFTESASAFSKVDSILEYTKGMLLKRNISSDLSKPIRRYDSEIEYIPTQFICEYIRYIAPHTDGIIFNSSIHVGGKNIVLFDQKKVECTSVIMHRITRVNIESIQI